MKKSNKVSYLKYEYNIFKNTKCGALHLHALSMGGIWYIVTWVTPSGC